MMRKTSACIAGQWHRDPGCGSGAPKVEAADCVHLRYYFYTAPGGTECRSQVRLLR